MPHALRLQQHLRCVFSLSTLCRGFDALHNHCAAGPLQCGQCEQMGERVSVVAKNREWRWEKRRPTATVRQNAAQEAETLKLTRALLGPCTNWSASKEKMEKRDPNTFTHIIRTLNDYIEHTHTHTNILKEPRDTQVLHREKKSSSQNSKANR